MHIIPLSTQPVLASQLNALPIELARTGRDTGFFRESDQLEVGNDSTAAWVWVREATAAGSALDEPRKHEYRGLTVLSTGQVTAFEALPTDFIGALVDTAELQRRAARLLASAAKHLLAHSSSVAFAATLSPLDNVFEGDPARVSGRTSGGIRGRQGLAAIMQPLMAVPSEAIIPHTGDIAAEIAATIIQSLRDTPR